MSDKSGPAFPYESGPYAKEGLTKREWFAGQALVGLISQCSRDYESQQSLEATVKWAFKYADTMLEEGEKP